MKERGFRIFGIVLLLIGFLSNPYTLGFFFSSEYSIFSPTDILCIVLIETAVFMAGIMILKKKKMLTIRALGFSFILVLFSLAAIEIGIRAIRYIAVPSSRVVDHRLLAEYFKDKSWAEDLLHEYRETYFEIVQYLGYKTGEYHGKYMNVDRDGRRNTWEPPTLSSAADTIFMFGGSTLWGQYVRDEGTIPSLASQLAHQDGLDLRIINYAERGYLFAQNIVHLSLLLKNGSRPKIVIVYQGVNDVISAYALGRVGVNGFEPELQKLLVFQREPMHRQLAIIIKRYCENNLLIYKAIGRFASMASRGTENGPHYTDEQLLQLSSNITIDFTRSYDLLDRLSKSYRFEYFFILQPLIFTKQHKTKEELDLDPFSRDRSLEQLYRDTYSAFDSLRLPHFQNLTHVFDNHPESLYLDFCHVNENGNAIIAREITDLMRH